MYISWCKDLSGNPIILEIPKFTVSKLSLPTDLCLNPAGQKHNKSGLRKLENRASPGAGAGVVEAATLSSTSLSSSSSFSLSLFSVNEIMHK